MANSSTDLTDDGMKTCETPAANMVKEVTIPRLDTEKLNEGKKMK